MLILSQTSLLYGYYSQLYILLTSISFFPFGSAHNPDYNFGNNFLTLEYAFNLGIKEYS